MQNLLKYVGLVADGDTYAQAITKVKDALQKRANRTAAVLKLFNGHAQGSQSFDSWHREVYKALSSSTGWAMMQTRRRRTRS